MGQTYTGLSGKTKDDFGHGQARFVTYMNVFSNPISNPEMTEPIEIDPKQNEVEVGDVFFTTSSETPEEVGMSSILLEKRGKTYLNSFCFGFRPSEKIDSYYLAYMLRSESTRAKIILLAQGISRYNISKNKVMEIAVSLPSLDEQKMIGQYFSQLDNLITLHQRQHFLHSTPDISLSVRLIHPFYTSSWEQRKLSEITDKVTEKNAGLQYVETFTNSAEFGIISQRDFFDHDIAKLGSLDGYYIVKNEDFVYNPRISTSAPVGPINRNKLGRTGVMSPLYTVFRPHDIDTTYLEYFFKCGYWHSFMNFNGDSGARSDRFSIRDNVFFQMPIPIPDIDEQRKIGELLTCLDNLITLHQRKCANLCSPSQVVFSLLFATSTFSWEQRKLGELGTITTGNTPSTSIPDYYSDDGIVWVTPTDICENITFESARKLSDLGQQVGRVVPKNTILVTCIASIGKNTMLGNTGSFNQQINGLTPNENKYDPYFLLTESALWSAKMKGSAASGTMQIVNRTEFSELKTWLPSLIEQQAIGAFFKQLDNLITLHQRKPFLMKWRTSDANRNQTNRLVL